MSDEDGVYTDEEFEALARDERADYMQEQEYKAEQCALPTHKRDDYVERMEAWADLDRKRIKEES
jgi:hypothetical protein